MMSRGESMADALGGVTLPWDEAKPIYDEALNRVTGALKDAGYTLGRVSPVGSFLRRDPVCRDVDILLEVIDTPTGRCSDRFETSIIGSRKSLKTLLNETKHLIEPLFDKPITSGLAVHGLLHDLQVDVFLATPDNWSSSFCIWAGDRVHNMHKFSCARKVGVTVWPWGTVTDAGELIVFEDPSSLLEYINIDETDVSMWSWRRDEIRRQAAEKNRQRRISERSRQGEDRG